LGISPRNCGYALANGAVIDALVWWGQKEPRMITAAECKTRQDQCQVQGTDPDIPMRRAVAIMAVCHAWSVMMRAVAEYELILKEEGK
jgi:hypothetical protein